MRAPIQKGFVVPPQVLASRARLMRFEASPAEAALWRATRGGRLGVLFRRQVPLLGQYVADFFASEAGLIVEVDGGWHATRAVADARRDEKLRRAGYRVVRVPAQVVLRNLPEAVRRVREALEPG